MGKILAFFWGIFYYLHGLCPHFKNFWYNLYYIKSENFFLGKISVNCWWNKYIIMRRCRFNIGDKIVCLRSEEYSYHTTSLFGIYEVVEIPSKMYDNIGIIDDNGIHIIPVWSEFLTIKEYRKLKLEKINNNIE